MDKENSTCDHAQFYSLYESNLIGPLTLTATEDALLRCSFGANLPSLAPGCKRKDDLPVLEQARDWLDRYFANKKPLPNELPLAPQGTPFQMLVWKKLAAIPYGKTVTYGEISESLKRDGHAASAQAVGGATGRNGIAVIIPCHRVLGANNNLTGFSGGLALKKKLLELEGVDISKLHEPRKRN